MNSPSFNEQRPIFPISSEDLQLGWKQVTESFGEREKDFEPEIKAMQNPRGASWRSWVTLASLFLLVGLTTFLVADVIFTSHAVAQVRLPGTDASDQLEAAGTLLRIIDTGLFKWGARIFAGICIMSAAWALKEQRFGIAIICIIGAIIFGTAPTWVRNIFSIGGSDSLFSSRSIEMKGDGHA